MFYKYIIQNIISKIYYQIYYEGILTSGRQCDSLYGKRYIYHTVCLTNPKRSTLLAG